MCSHPISSRPSKSSISPLGPLETRLNALFRARNGLETGRKGPKRAEKAEVKLHFPKPDSSMRMAQAFLQFGSAAARRRAHTKNESCATWSKCPDRDLDSAMETAS